MRFTLLIIFLIFSFHVHAQEMVQPENTYTIAKKQSITANTYMVVVAHPLAAEVGRDVLARGGSAADAAIAIQFMLNLVEPQSSGIGGGAFALYWDASEKRLTSFDGRETAPQSTTSDYWIKDGKPVNWRDAVVGSRSVGVPGTLKLLETLHQKFGIHDWSGLIEPTIEKAENGFEISDRLAASIASAKDFDLGKFDATRSYFFDDNVAPLPAGYLLKNKPFANALKKIAKGGSKPFYEGDIANDIVNAVQAITHDDLKSYHVIERDAVCALYRTYDVCGMGPPSSGALTVGQILGMLEPYNMRALGPSGHAYHLFAEAQKLAFADRALYMADSDFVDMPVQGLLDKNYLRSRSQLIHPFHAIKDAQAGSPPWEKKISYAPNTHDPRPGTSHFVVVDSHGDMISMTTTIETGFGSRVMTNGFLLNNEMTDFSFVPEKDGKPVANRVEPGKRPRSSMSPTIVFKDGDPVLLTGSPGGASIISYTAQSIIAILDWDMMPQTAVDLPHVVNTGGKTIIEDETLVEPFKTRGHDVVVRDLNSGLHAIFIKDGVFIGGADKRREGVVLGE